MTKPTLKSLGVPFGARVVFKLQWLPYLLFTVLLLISTPFLVIWALCHKSGLRFMNGMTDSMQRKLDVISEHKRKLVKMYGGNND